MLKNYTETSDGVIKQVENFGEKKLYNTLKEYFDGFTILQEKDIKR